MTGLSTCATASSLAATSAKPMSAPEANTGLPLTVPTFVTLDAGLAVLSQVCVAPGAISPATSQIAPY